MSNYSRFETPAKPTKRHARGPQDLFRLQKMINEMRRVVASLDAEIALEENRAHVHDQSHYAYPIAAKSMRARRDNLLQTIAALDAQLKATLPVNEPEFSAA